MKKDYRFLTLIIIVAFVPCYLAINTNSMINFLLQAHLNSYLAPSTACSADCKDSSISCMAMNRNMLCSKSMMSIIYYRQMCPLTCGKCTPCPKITPGCRSGECIDINPLMCPAYKMKNMCHLSSAVNQCQKTCGLCAKECVFPPTQCSNDCVDQKIECPMWYARDSSYCSSYPDMKTVCPKSCKTCIPCSTN